MDVIPGRYTPQLGSKRPKRAITYCSVPNTAARSTQRCWRESLSIPRVSLTSGLENAANFMERMTPVEAGETLYHPSRLRAVSLG